MPAALAEFTDALAVAEQLRRPRRGGDGPPRPRPGARDERAACRGLRRARRRDGRRHRRRGVADRRRARLLRGHRHVPHDVRSAPGPGVDGSTEQVVRVAARPRALSRPVSRPSGRDPADPRRVVRRDGGGRAGLRAALPPARRIRRSATRCTAKPSCCGCAATSRGPRRRMVGPASAGASPSPVWRCSGSPRGRSPSPWRRSAVPLDETSDPRARLHLIGRPRRDRCSPPTTSAPPVSPPTSWPASPPTSAGRRSGRRPGTRPGPSSSPRAIPGRPRRCSGRRGPPGATSRRRTKRRGFGWPSAWPAAGSATRTARRWSSSAAHRAFRQLGAETDRRRVEQLAGAAAEPRKAG